MADGKMIPASVSIGSIPDEAKSEGSLNETLAKSKRNPPTPRKLDEGPKRGDKGQFEPAAYKTNSGNTRVDR
jgi:hypothetical protein